MDYLIGDTIRLKAVIKDFAGTETAPGSEPTVSVFELDETELLSSGVSALSTGTTAQYYYDWLVPVTLTTNTELIMVWSWDALHKKKKTFSVVTILS